MKILFIHQNFPGQFKCLAPALSIDPEHDVRALSSRASQQQQWQGVSLLSYQPTRQGTANQHPWLIDVESKAIRGEACFHALKTLKRSGFTPDVVLAHPGWGESLFVKEVWPATKLAIYCEFFYHASGADVGFDPEITPTTETEACRIRLKNINNFVHFDIADAGIAPTHWQAQSFPDYFRSKITVSHDGIDTDLIQPNPAATITLRDTQGHDQTYSRRHEIITYVARNLEPYRGVHTFLRCLPSLLKQRPNATVMIVGENSSSYGPASQGVSYRDRFLTEVRPQLSDAEWARVRFLGRLPYPAFIQLLQISTVHIYLTYPFVLSWSMLEAMSAGCAIVASRTPPVQEVIEHDANGRLVDFFNPDELANAVAELAGDPESRNRLGQAARNHVVQHYDLKRVCLPKQLSWVQSLN